MTSRIYGRLGVVVLLFVLGQGESMAQHEEHALALLQMYQGEIVRAAGALHVSPRLLASIVYAERSTNIRPGEDVVDVVLARTGYNSSVGIAQVKVETANWILAELTDPGSRWYSGPEVARLFSGVLGNQDLVDQLTDPGKNLIFAAGYISMIERYWESVFNTVVETRKRVALVAALYSLGLKKVDGTFRDPHLGARPNEFGRVAGEFYDSFALRAELPE